MYPAKGKHALLALVRLEKVGFGTARLHMHEHRHRVLTSLWLFLEDSPSIQADNSIRSPDKEQGKKSATIFKNVETREQLNNVWKDYISIFERQVALHRSGSSSVSAPWVFGATCVQSHRRLPSQPSTAQTTQTGLISRKDEPTYRWDIDHLVTLCRQNNLELNTLQTVVIVVDIRKSPALLLPTHYYHTGPQVGEEYELWHR